jgi:hypothetical protein
MEDPQNSSGFNSKMVDHDLDDLELPPWLRKPRNSLSRNMHYGNREPLDDFAATLRLLEVPMFSMLVSDIHM